jgi:predicted phosphodiesterase
MKNINFRKNTTILIGDTHSMSSTYEILNIDIPNGSDVVHMGDAGLGFGDLIYSIPATISWLERYNDLCKKIDVNLIIIRGNHDATYDKIWSSTWSNIFLIKDYGIGIFPNGKRVLFVGGGISIDRTYRVQGNTYWYDEITPKLDNVPLSDIVFGHDAPEHFNHSTKSLRDTFKGLVERDPMLISDALDQRMNLSDILKRSGAKTWFSGHFHNDRREERDGVYYRCLDINELFEFDSNKIYKL